jgi:prepilin-type N-terminal cleavage/methylation domain-containing protein
MKRKQSGFTLIEISIVLVIIGLILGGALKGQELIQAAKVRSTINQIDGVKAAYYAFQDRFRALPGDYSQATVNLPNPPPGTTINNGSGNGQVAGGAGLGQVWLHLGVAGFLSGDFDGNTGGNVYNCPDTTCLTNPFSGAMHFGFDNEANGTAGNSHELLSRRRIPMGIVAEIDRKIDDDQPNGGSFQASQNGAFASCLTGNVWNAAAASPSHDCVGVIVGL